MNPVAGMSHALGGSAESAGVRWLEDSKHSLDWNGPRTRIFTRSRDEDLDWPIIDHFERVARRHRNRLTVTDSETSLYLYGIVGSPLGTGRNHRGRNQAGRPDRHHTPTCSMFPLAMLACLAAGRPLSPWIPTIQTTGCARCWKMPGQF